MALLVPLTVQAQAPTPPSLSPTWTVAATDGTFIDDTDNAARGAAINPATDHVLVASRTGSNQIVVLNATSGATVGSLLMTDASNNPVVTGGTLPLNQVGATADGQIFAANLAGAATGAAPLKIYRWENEQANPTLVYSGGPSTTAYRYGDSFAVWGSGTNVKIYVSGGGSPGNPTIAEFTWTGTAPMAEPRLIPVTAGTARGSIAPGSSASTLWINGAGTPTQEIDLTAAGTTPVVVRQIAGTLSAASSMAVASFEIEGRQFIVSGIKTTGMEADVIEVTVPGQEAVVARIPAFGTRANTGATGAIVYDAERNQVILLGTNNGLAAYSMDFLRPRVLDAPVWALDAGTQPWFAADNNTRGAAYNPTTDHVIVVSRTGGLNMRLLDAATGTEVGTMDVTGIAGGAFALSEIAVTADGQIFGANLTTAPSTSPLKIYRWRHERARPELVYSGAPEGPRYGDALGLSGTGSGVDLFVSGTGNDRIARLRWDGTAVTAVTSLQPVAGQARGRYGLAPVPGESLWINGPGTPLTLVNASTGAVLREVTDLPSTLAAGDLFAYSMGGRDYVVTGPQSALEEFVIVDVTTAGAEFIAGRTPVLGTTANGNAAGAVTWDTRRNNLVVMSTNNRIASFAMAPAPASVPPLASLIVAPPDGAAVTVEGNPEALFSPSWTAALSTPETPFTYTWELSASPTFATLLLSVGAADTTSIALRLQDVDALLASAGVESGGSVMVYHRAVATNADTVLVGAYSTVTLTRGMIVAGESPRGDLAFGVDDAYPNPVRGSQAMLRFTLPAQADVQVEVFDVLGRRVLVVPTAAMAAGADQTIALDASALSAGSYVWRLTAQSGGEVLRRNGRLTVVR